MLGGGTIGLLAAAVAATRSDDVTISVRHPQQRAAAERLGVTVIDEPEAIGWGKQSRPEVVIETVGGDATTLDDAIAVVRRGGTIVVLGTFLRVPVNLFAAGQKEAAIVSSFAYGQSPTVGPTSSAGAGCSATWRRRSTASSPTGSRSRRSPPPSMRPTTSRRAP